MARAPDALTVRQSFVIAWIRLKWIFLSVFVLSPISSYWILSNVTVGLNRFDYIRPILMTEITVLPFVSIVILCTHANAIRYAPTPMEREAQERENLSRLKQKYEGQ